MSFTRMVGILVLLAGVAMGQDRMAFRLVDGTMVTGSVLTGDPRSIVVQTDSGRVALARGSIARAETLVTPIRLLSTPVADTDLRALGNEAGRRAADDAPGGSALVATCCASSVCLPVAGPIAASLVWRSSNARVPPSLLPGATGEYAAGLTEGYVQRMTERRRAEAIYGIVGGSAVFTALVIFVTYQVSHTVDGVHFDLGWGDL